MVVELGHVACATAPEAFAISTPVRPQQPEPPPGVEDPMHQSRDPWQGQATSSNQPMPGQQFEVPGILNCMTGTQTSSPFQTQASRIYQEACK